MEVPNTESLSGVLFFRIIQITHNRAGDSHMICNDGTLFKTYTFCESKQLFFEICA